MSTDDERNPDPSTAMDADMVELTERLSALQIHSVAVDQYPGPADSTPRSAVPNAKPSSPTNNGLHQGLANPKPAANKQARQKLARQSGNSNNSSASKTTTRKATVPSQLWKFFDPDTEDVILEPVEPVQALEELAPEGNEPPGVRNARLNRNLPEEDLFFKRHTIFRENERKWDKFHEVQAKLRERILLTVAPQKKASLRTIYSVRQWLTDLRNTTALPTETIKQNIQAEYQKLMGVALLDWPSGGPTNCQGS
ncbi:hypothetical protein MMC07_006467 [Pseudocyphellaria aurata]|nr:hypothetical protein [Pseudocyphellaria aurata]